jgi:hypothetical protein
VEDLESSRAVGMTVSEVCDTQAKILPRMMTQREG